MEGIGIDAETSGTHFEITSNSKTAIDQIS